MSTLIDTATSGRLSDGIFFISMSSGNEITFPVVENPRLRNASIEEILDFEITPLGIHWPALDEDLSISGLLQGDWGQPQQ